MKQTSSTMWSKSLGKFKCLRFQKIMTHLQHQWEVIFRADTTIYWNSNFVVFISAMKIWKRPSKLGFFSKNAEMINMHNNRKSTRFIWVFVVCTWNVKLWPKSKQASFWLPSLKTQTKNKTVLLKGLRPIMIHNSRCCA